MKRFSDPTLEARRGEARAQSAAPVDTPLRPDERSMGRYIDRTIDLRTVRAVGRRIRKSPWIRMVTGAFRVLPDFIIIGGQRCGTTTLYRLLSQHPDVFPGRRKEPAFFERGFHRGTRWYRANFPSTALKSWITTVRGGHFVTGEATVYYLFHPHAPARIARTLPGIKLIALLRNPVDRAYSHYQFKVARGQEHLSSFEAAIDAEAERLAGERDRMLADSTYDSPPYRHFSYLSRGVYFDQLSVWTRLFPPEQLLILKSEDLYSDPRSTVQRVFEYLGVPGYDLGHYGSYNAGNYPAMNRQTRRRLVEFFEPHNKRLYEFLGRDFAWDGEGGGWH